MEILLTFFSIDFILIMFLHKLFLSLFHGGHYLLCAVIMSGCNVKKSVRAITRTGYTCMVS